MPLTLTTAEDRNAQAAFEAYAEMRKHEAGHPQLRLNPFWNGLVDAAFHQALREGWGE